MSKPITIVSVMTLIEQGKIKLDDPVSKYIPSFESLTCKSPNGSYKCNNVMTVYHLMTHRSGLRYCVSSSTPSTGMCICSRFLSEHDSVHLEGIVSKRFTA